MLNIVCECFSNRTPFTLWVILCNVIYLTNILQILWLVWVWNIFLVFVAIIILGYTAKWSGLESENALIIIDFFFYRSSSKESYWMINFFQNTTRAFAHTIYYTIFPIFSLQWWVIPLNLYRYSGSDIWVYIFIITKVCSVKSTVLSSTCCLRAESYLT